jgi:hypothetical protein
MKKNFYLSLFLLIPLMAFSQSKTQQQAFSEASAFLQKLNPTVTFSQSSPAKTMTQSSTATNEAQPYYVFNADNGKGFVIVSGDERTESILGYSDKGRIDMDNLPDGLKVLLQQYAAEIKSLGSTTTTAVKAKAASTSTVSATKASISPLVNCHWGQDSPYNDNCPSGCVTGCVATAMAQIMYYWGNQKGYNLKTTDIPAYTTLENGYPRSALSATTFAWSSMIDSYSNSGWGSSNYTTTQANAVAKLLQYVGQSVRMDYGSSSNAWGSDVCRAYRDYLGFDKHTRDAYRQDYTASEWDDLLYNEVAAGRPVEITGSFSNGDADKTWSGHSFICDGYSSSNEGFHINWGWDGQDEGYFKLSSLNPYGYGNYSFCIYENATIGIQPPVTGNVEETESTRLTVADFVCSGAKSFTRTNRYSDFNGISVFAGIFNHLQNPNSFDAAVGLYKGDELLKVMSIKRIGYYESEDGYGREQCFDNLSFGAELPYGDYTLKPISKGTTDTEWMADVKAERHYITATISETGLTLTPSIPLKVNSLSSTQASVTNEGSEESSAFLYMYSGSTLKSVVQTAIPGNTTSTLTFPVSGNKITTDFDGKNIIYPSQSQYISLSAETINATDANVVAGSNLKVNVTVTNKGTSDYSGTVKAGTASQSVSVAVGSAQTVTLSVPVSSSGTAVTATCGSESLSLGTFTSGKGVVFYNGDGTHSCKADAAISSLSDNVACIDLTNSSKDYSSTTLSANPNCIYLFGSSASVPSNFNGKNVVKGTTADNISLQDGYDFYCPISFTASKINYTRTFTKGTTGGDDGQWSSIILPFKPTSVTVDSKTIDWFHSKTDVQGSFWLFGFTGDNSGTVNFDYVPQNGMEANTPYIITVPADTWGAENDLSNKALVFSATDATINTTKGVVKGTDYDFIGWPFNMKRLSVNEYKLNDEGNSFALISDESLKTIEPFRAYFVTYTSNANAKLNIGLPDDETTGVNMPQVSGTDNQGDVYTISGMKVRTATQSTKGLEKGIYIVNGKKVIK